MDAGTTTDKDLDTGGYTAKTCEASAAMTGATEYRAKSEDTVFVCQAVFLPQCIIWIKRLVFFHHGPRDMQQFPGGGTAGHFLWLADLP